MRDFISKILLCLVLVLLVISFLNAKLLGQIMWQKHYDFHENDYGTHLRFNSQGDLFLAGCDNITFWNILKINPFNGDTIWTKERERDPPGAGPGFTGLQGLAIDSNDNIFASGHDALGNYLLIKYNPNGDSLWSKKYDNSGFEVNIGGCFVKDYNPILTGVSTISQMAWWTIKLNGDGDTVWTAFNNIYGMPYDLIEDDSNNILVVGEDESNYNTTLLKLNPDGNELWTKGYDVNNERDTGRGVAIDRDKNIVICGHCGNTTHSIYVLKLNPNGDSLWCRIFDFANDEYASSIAIDSLNYYHITGFAEDTANTGILLILDSDGNIATWTFYNGIGKAYYSDVCIGADNSIFVVGSEEIGAQRDMLALKYSGAGGILERDKERIIFSNPRQNKMKLIYRSIIRGDARITIRGFQEPEGLSLDVLDFSGKKLSVSYNMMIREIDLNIGNFPSGIYFLRFRFGKKVVCTKKIVKID